MSEALNRIKTIITRMSVEGDAQTVWLGPIPRVPRTRQIPRTLGNTMAEYDELKGTDWKWQSMDGAMTKSPLGGGKNWEKPDRSRQARRQTLDADRWPRGSGVTRDCEPFGVKLEYFISGSVFCVSGFSASARTWSMSIVSCILRMNTFAIFSTLADGQAW